MTVCILVHHLLMNRFLYELINEMEKTMHPILFFAEAEKLKHAKNTKELGRYRLYAILDLVYRHRFATPHVVKTMFGLKGSSEYRILNGYAKKNFLRKVPTANPMSPWIYILTKSGMSILFNSWSHIGYVEEKELRPFYDPSKLNLNNMTHTLATQIVTLDLLLNDENDYVSYLSERELEADGSKKSLKQPDVLVADKNGQNILAVEVELTLKSKRALDHSFASNKKILMTGEAGYQASRVAYITQSPMIFKKLDKLARSKEIDRWIRDKDQGRWIKSGTVKMHEIVDKDLIDIYHYEHLNRLYP